MEKFKVLTYRKQHETLSKCLKVSKSNSDIPSYQYFFNKIKNLLKCATSEGISPKEII